MNPQIKATATKMRKNQSKPAACRFLLLFFCSSMVFLVLAQNTKVPVNVGVVYNSDVLDGKISFSCVKMAISDFYATNPHYKTRILLNVRDSGSDVVDAAASALDLIKDVQVQAILGPATSMQADFVIKLGEKAQVPIISFSATSPSLTSIRSPYFFRATENDSVQVNAISALVQDFGWRQAVPIYVDDEYGEGVIPYLTDALENVNTRVPYRSAISGSASDDQIVEELYKLMTMQTRVFIVHMLPPLGSRLFGKAKEIGMMSEGYVWIMTNGMTDLLSTLDSSVIDSMQGVLGVKTYVSKTKELEEFRVRWKRKFQVDNPVTVGAELSIYGLWGYDAIVALAMAIEKVGTANLGFQKPNISGNSSSDLESLGLSLNGPNLVQELSNTSFTGLTGKFLLVDRQLQSSAFQIVNINGNGERNVGFWSLEKGLVKYLKSSTSATTTNSGSTPNNLAPILWPGDSTSVPRGWEIPTNGKKLRIGVPVKEGFIEFVKVKRDNSTNSPTVTGYCIDVFDAVAEALPFALTYQYIPFAKHDGNPAGTYNDLVYEVYKGNFDAVVGDTTITSNRSKYVDFSLPYTESGVSMIVPIKDSKSKNAWVFLKPLTWDLWLTSFLFFLFIGFVVWVLEHRLNDDFRGPVSHQAGTSLWFSFSTMVFAHREKVVSSLARVVIVVWCFIVLILTQNYTASLTSFLTVQQLQPTVTDVRQLIKNGEHVGYLNGSFVLGILKGLGFDQSKIVMYNSPEELDELFNKGRENGGIAAAFDEVPYTKLFLSQYCSKYTSIDPTFKADGFGFVFPISSPLVSYINRAVLTVTEGHKMKEIKAAWFGKDRNCPDPSTTVSSTSIGMISFWGLFLIAGVAAVLALLIFLVIFIYENRKILLEPDSKPPEPYPDDRVLEGHEYQKPPESHPDYPDLESPEDQKLPERKPSSVRSRIRNLLRKFDQKDLRSPTFRKGGVSNRSGADINSRRSVNPVSTGELSPSTFSVHTEFPGEQETPPSEYGNGDRNGEHQEVVPDAIELPSLNQGRASTSEITEEPN